MIFYYSCCSFSSFCLWFLSQGLSCVPMNWPVINTQDILTDSTNVLNFQSHPGRRIPELKRMLLCSPWLTRWTLPTSIFLWVKDTFPALSPPTTPPLPAPSPCTPYVVTFDPRPFPLVLSQQSVARVQPLHASGHLLLRQVRRGGGDLREWQQHAAQADRGSDGQQGDHRGPLSAGARWWPHQHAPSLRTRIGDSWEILGGYIQTTTKKTFALNNSYI